MSLDLPSHLPLLLPQLPQLLLFRGTDELAYLCVAIVVFGIHDAVQSYLLWRVPRHILLGSSHAVGQDPVHVLVRVWIDWYW